MVLEFRFQQMTLIHIALGAGDTIFDFHAFHFVEFFLLDGKQFFDLFIGNPI